MSYIRLFNLKQTRPQVHLWNMKSSTPNKQILWMLKPLDLLSLLATHQWNKQINLHFFFLSLHVIVEIYQIRTDNWIKFIDPNKINKIRCIAYHQNKRILRLTIIWFDFIEILETSISSSTVSIILTSWSFSIIGFSLFSSKIILF